MRKAILRQDAAKELSLDYDNSIRDINSKDFILRLLHRATWTILCEPTAMF